MTPEGKVKAKVKKLFATYGDTLCANWIVQNGMGSPTLDVIVCFHGRYLSVETKAAGKELTARQEITAAKIERAGGHAFRVRDDGELEVLADWLRDVHDIYSVYKGLEK